MHSHMLLPDFKLVVPYDQGRAFRGRKFRIFLEKAIIALKHHSRHLLTEDFYIFIFFDIYRQGKY